LCFKADGLIGKPARSSVNAAQPFKSAERRALGVGFISAAQLGWAIALFATTTASQKRLFLVRGRWQRRCQLRQRDQNCWAALHRVGMRRCGVHGSKHSLTCTP